MCDKDAFETWIQNCINSFGSGQEPSEIQVTMQPPHLKSSSVYVSAKAALKPPHEDCEAPDSTELEHFPVHIMFSDITWHRDRKRRQSIKGRGTPYLSTSRSIRHRSTSSTGRDPMHARIGEAENVLASVEVLPSPLEATDGRKGKQKKLLPL
eukprot:gnl/TRDRNA2_/TRDRNA2_169108_c1_seq1.p1 gnl/TRDRNA2_/TRDRNA2_169108_c1~~gnl/TRDRNA2_/TRDRNA2_169108_c1_seq1.p1  ORF type:complete len:161 (+),score=22.88 gnl/TRDRNA2_/TRDRNA2_169108_c1_seq1:26-484(+)